MAVVYSTKFSVVSYNVLAQSLSQSRHFPYCKKSTLKQSNRQRALREQLSAIAADIFCLQEVDLYGEFFLPVLGAQGYRGLYKQKTGIKKDGCAVFFKADKFDLVSMHSVEFNEIAEKISDPDAQSHVRRDCVALIAILQPKPPPPPHFGSHHHHRPNADPLPCTRTPTPTMSPRRLCVVTTHVFWDPAHPDLKLAQVDHLLQAISKISEDHLATTGSPLPIILAGDFNSLPTSAVYQLLSTGQCSLNTSRHLAQLCHPQRPHAGAAESSLECSHSLDLISAYGTYNKSAGGSEPPFTNYTENFKGTLDYIFFTRSSLQLISVMELPPEERLTTCVALPNAAFPSDHLPIGCVFSLPHFPDTHSLS